MSDLSVETFLKAVKQIKAPTSTPTENSKKNEKKKKMGFNHSIELQVSFKNIDRDKETGFKSSVLLDHPLRKPKFSICFLANEKDAPKGHQLGLTVLMKSDLVLLKSDKKECKKLSKKFDCFFSSVSMIKEIPPALRKNLARRDKFPKTILKAEELSKEIEEAKRRVKIVLKVKPKCSLNLGFAVGKYSMKDTEVAKNIVKVMGEIISQSKKKVNNIKGVVVKKTLGKAVRVM